MFDYRCEPCALDFEAFVLRSTITPECPTCKGSAVSRRLSGFSVGVSSSDAKSGGNYLGRARMGGGFGCGAGCACH